MPNLAYAAPNALIDGIARIHIWKGGSDRVFVLPTMPSTHQDN